MKVMVPCWSVLDGDIGHWVDLEVIHNQPEPHEPSFSVYIKPIPKLPA